MQRKFSGWMLVGGAARLADRILDLFLSLCLAAGLLYGGFGLWDAWNIYQKASGEALSAYKPTPAEDGSNPSLEELQKLNPDVIAWLTVDGTGIDYPVVQGEDNYEYLSKDVSGEYSMAGALFLDYANSPDFSDFYSLIHGHNMSGGVMFGQLVDFRKKDFFDGHTTGTLLLRDETLSIEWFACVCTEAYDGQVFYPDHIQEEEQKEYLLTYIKSKAEHYRDLGVTANDRLVALSTCASAVTADRVLLFGRISLPD